MQVRFARHTDRLSEVVGFYRDRLGLPQLGQFADHDGYDGVFLGLPGTGAHLELTSGGGHGAPTPHAETLLVLYLGSPRSGWLPGRPRPGGVGGWVTREYPVPGTGYSPCDARAWAAETTSPLRSYMSAARPNSCRAASASPAAASTRSEHHEGVRPVLDIVGRLAQRARLTSERQGLGMPAPPRQEQRLRRPPERL